MIERSNPDISRLHTPRVALSGSRESREAEDPRAEDLREPARRGSGPLHADAVDRLTRLRRILPVIGEELAVARREAARLRLENRRLVEQVRELERGPVTGKPRLARGG